jgi:hypothetical protein
MQERGREYRYQPSVSSAVWMEISLAAFGMAACLLPRTGRMPERYTRLTQPGWHPYGGRHGPLPSHAADVSAQIRATAAAGENCSDGSPGSSTENFLELVLLNCLIYRAFPPPSPISTPSNPPRSFFFSPRLCLGPFLSIRIHSIWAPWLPLLSACALPALCSSKAPPL